jgi:acyl dehydratase
MKFYEDMPIGLSAAPAARFTFTAEAIKSFASEWDPMPFHVDEEAARQSPVGKLFATSIHTIAASVKLNHTAMTEPMAVIAGLGWQDVRFPLPVCAGDTIRVHSEVVDRRESQSKPDRGIVTSQISVFNQHDQRVAEYKILTLILKRPVG